MSENAEKPFRLVQITDCHLGGDPGEELLGLNTEESFLDVLKLVQAHEHDIDYIVTSGDIASMGAEPAYHRFLKFVKNYLPYPLAWLPGNHDLATLMRSLEAAYASSETPVQGGFVDTDRWRIILLDSSVPGSEFGAIADSEITRLKTLLDQTDKHVLVFVHHQPIPVGCKWVDQYIIKNHSELFAALKTNERVKGIVFGHVHQEFNGEKDGLPIIATPSTCIQFSPNSDDFKVDTAMPGYRWFNLHNDGRFETDVVRLPHKDYGIDYESGGY